jgi:hypothetical protein
VKSLESVYAEDTKFGRRTAEQVKFRGFRLLIVFSLMHMWVLDSGIYCLVKCNTNVSVVKTQTFKKT